MTFPTEEQKKRISGILEACSEYDGFTYELDFDESFRKEGEYNTFLLSDEHSDLAVANLFTPTAHEGELSIYTIPSRRREGHAASLAGAASRELIRRGYESILYVIPGGQRPGAAFATSEGARYEYSEYAMRFDRSVRLSEPKAEQDGIRIRDARLEDCPKLAELMTRSFGDTPEDARRYLEGTLGKPGRRMIVAVRDTVVVGMASTITDPRRCYIHGLCVLPEERNKGIGSILLSALVLSASKTDLPIELEVAVENPKALALYERKGFSITARYDYHRKVL